jgi:hypothetical protein
VAAPHCTTKLENAHSTEFRELLYPWHPWSDLRIGIHEAIERPGGVVFRCDLTASDAHRWLEIPAWMFDRSACAKVRLAVEPHTDLSALVMLGALLRDVRNIRSTASDAADSSVSPLPGDQNRGETHATPDSARRRVPQQIELFAENAPTIGGMWAPVTTRSDVAVTRPARPRDQRLRHRGPFNACVAHLAPYLSACNDRYCSHLRCFHSSSETGFAE